MSGELESAMARKKQRTRIEEEEAAKANADDSSLPDMDI